MENASTSCLNCGRSGHMHLQCDAPRSLAGDIKIWKFLNKFGILQITKGVGHHTTGRATLCRRAQSVLRQNGKQRPNLERQQYGPTRKLNCKGMGLEFDQSQSDMQSSNTLLATISGEAFDQTTDHPLLRRKRAEALKMADKLDSPLYYNDETTEEHLENERQPPHSMVATENPFITTETLDLLLNLLVRRRSTRSTRSPRPLTLDSLANTPDSTATRSSSSSAPPARRRVSHRGRIVASWMPDWSSRSCFFYVMALSA